MTQSRPIYKMDSNGGIRTWSYQVDGARWCTTAGGPGRKPVTSGWTTCKGKQGRSDEQQAEFEADAAEEQKLAREYRRTEAELASVPKGVMLAKSYEGGLTYPVFCQPKLDGIRALISRHGAFSREYQRHLNVEHILEALGPVFKEWPDLVLDGELYNHNFKDNFGRISSIVRKQNPTPEQRAEASKYLEYHVYDVADDTHPFCDRMIMLDMVGLKARHGASGPVIIVPTDAAASTGDLDRIYGQYLEQGYEGQMVRLNAPYEFDKRSKALLKRKEFITAEFKLLFVREGQGNWAGYAKQIIFQLPDGRECGAGVRGTQDEMKALLGKAYLGAVKPESTVTIRHFTPTPDGVPRFPVAVDFHFGGRKD